VLPEEYQQKERQRNKFLWVIAIMAIAICFVLFYKPQIEKYVVEYTADRKVAFEKYIAPEDTVEVYMDQVLDTFAVCWDETKSVTEDSTLFKVFEELKGY